MAAARKQNFEILASNRHIQIDESRIVQRTKMRLCLAIHLAFELLTRNTLPCVRYLVFLSSPDSSTLTSLCLVLISRLYSCSAGSSAMMSITQYDASTQEHHNHWCLVCNRGAIVIPVATQQNRKDKLKKIIDIHRHPRCLEQLVRHNCLCTTTPEANARA